MTQRQMRFIEAYSAGGDAAQAAVAAGYSAARARRQGEELLKRPEVAEAVAAAQQARAEEVTHARILRELARIAFSGTEVRDGDKLRALEMLTKLLPPDGGADGGDGRACGVVFLPEVMEETGQ